MSDILSSSLKKAVKGTALLSVGSTIKLPLAFIIKVLIVRYTTKAEFGIYSLAIAVVSILSFVSIFGLRMGSPRYISVLKGRGEQKKMKEVITSSLHIGIVGGLSSFLILYFAASFISVKIFNITDLAKPLKVISFSIPFAALTTILIAIFRGHGIIKPKVYFQDLGQRLIFLILLALIIVRTLPFINILFAYLLSNILVFVLLFIYAHKKVNLGPVFSTKTIRIPRKLLLFSIPLLLTGLRGTVFNWTDTLMLGYFREAEDVGLYNVGLSLARLLMIPLTSLTFVFMPISGYLYSKNNMPELKRAYQVLTKWIFSTILPLFFIIFLFPEMVLGFLFGERYIEAATILRILALGYMLHTFMGANDMILMVLGKSKLLMWIAFFGATLNILLNYIFIPIYGTLGAAFAMVISYSALNIANSIKLYQHSQIHPLTLKYLKPIFASSAVALTIYLFAKSIQIKLWMLPIFFVLFVVGYIISLILTKSIDEEDVFIFKTIERKAGIDLKTIKNIVGKLLS
jgi:O-antigen/teichoic acid export membrane protein